MGQLAQDSLKPGAPAPSPQKQVPQSAPQVWQVSPALQRRLPQYAGAGGGGQGPQSAPQDWQVSALNDQHAYLRGSGAQNEALHVGDLVALGISHPCTTFDKWRWMPVVDDDYTVCDAIVTCF